MKNSLIGKLSEQKIIDILKIILNIGSYLLKKSLSKDKSTEKLLLKKVFIKCNINSEKINYNYELLTFLYNFETKEYLDYIVNKNFETFIDIWSNIWRLSWVNVIFWKSKNILLCDPNPFVFKLSQKFFLNHIKTDKNILFYNNAISNKSTNLPFYIIDNNKLNWIWSLHKENIKTNNIEEINISTITFKELLKSANIKNNNYNDILIKIDVEWHEKFVLESIIEYFENDNIMTRLTILVEIFDKNLHIIKSLLESTNYSYKINKISYHDYLIILNKEKYQ